MEGVTGEEKDNKNLFTLHFQFQLIGCSVCQTYSMHHFCYIEKTSSRITIGSFSH